MQEETNIGNVTLSPTENVPISFSNSFLTLFATMVVSLLFIEQNSNI
jgi:hypothetical protein